MYINNRFEIGDFITCRGKYGTITDIRVYIPRSKKVSIKYMTTAHEQSWISENEITISSEIKMHSDYLHRVMTTIDDMYA